MTIDKATHRALLKPLRKRSHQLTSRQTLQRALKRFDMRAEGEAVLPHLVGAMKEAHAAAQSPQPKGLDWARRMISLVRALYAARRISHQEYVFFAASTVEVIHDARWLRGEYESELQTINDAMDAVRDAHGLHADEYWTRGSAPAEYDELEDRYEAVMEEAFVRMLGEFDLTELASLRATNPDEFDRLRERGRRSVFHKDAVIPALRDIVIRYEEDARRAASASAFSAAITSLGAGLEGLLLLRCLKSKAKAKRAAQSLPRRHRPRCPDDPSTWTFDALIETCLAAGWLPPVSTAAAEYDPAGLAHLLRLMRNYIHPARRARERPWIEPEEDDYRDAEAIYVTLMSKIIPKARGSTPPSSSVSIAGDQAAEGHK